MTFTKRFTTAIATGAVLINALAPVALASTNVTVTGNGALSNNAVNLSTNTTSSVNQTNTANVVNNVNSSANSGGNSSNFNTGGDSVIKTGNATTFTNVTTAANMNKADVANCGNCGGATNVTVSGNGGFSENGVSVNKTNAAFVNQTNNANVLNDVNAKANSGKNDNSFNTGGDSVIKTGEASSVVLLDTKANANEARVGGGHGNAGTDSVTLSGNGAFSENGVALNKNSAVVLDQFNVAQVTNLVDAKANSGKNDSTFNTGGVVYVETGKASTGVSVDNAVNFNSAEVGCDCLLGGLELKIAGNGAESFNGVGADVEDAFFAGQDNLALLLNQVDDKAKSGYNDVSYSTGDPSDDPMVKTGDASSTTFVENTGNANVLNNGSTVHLPGDLDLDLHFDLFDLWAGFLHMVV